MFEFENGRIGLIPAADWLDVGFNVNRPNDPIDGLFGDERTDNLVARWQSIAAEYQIPMMAQFHGFDTEAQKTFRVPVDVHNVEKGLIKVKLNQSERMRALQDMGVKGNQALYEYVIGDGVRLADQVTTRTKVAKNELMAYGKVTIKENNLDLTVDYGVPANQLAYTIDVSDAGDPLSDIQTIIDDAAAKGVVLNGVLTSNQMLSKLRKHAKVQAAINGTTGGMVKRQELLDHFAAEFGLDQVVTNDLSYGASDSIGTDGRPVVKTARYYPADRMTFFATNPAGKMGAGLWGLPPEATASQYLDTANAPENPYVFVTQWAENDPAVVWTKASALFMPVLYNPNALWIATATGAAAAASEPAAGE